MSQGVNIYIPLYVKVFLKNRSQFVGRSWFAETADTESEVSEKLRMCQRTL